ncbi:MAG: hypothetical protein GEU95_25545 [Rhizobiales bacterium]|nr:hypothetical protein [Hyphomicrobiales bacterium]
MRKTLAVAALAGLTIASSMIATTGQADAHFRRWGPAIGFGIASGIVAGAIIANSGPAYERCGWLRQYDRYGNYRGRAWVCNY